MEMNVSKLVLAEVFCTSHLQDPTTDLQPFFDSVLSEAPSGKYLPCLCSQVTLNIWVMPSFVCLPSSSSSMAFFKVLCSY